MASAWAIRQRAIVSTRGGWITAPVRWVSIPRIGNGARFQLRRARRSGAVDVKP